MLTVVHEPHFLFLAARLTLQGHFQRGWPPPHVVVFDDVDSRTKFCGTFGFCGGDVLSHPLALELILRQSEQSDATYLWLRRWLSDGSRQGRGPTQFDASGCSLRSHPRVYQSVKKVLGALNGPPECTAFFVADAESLPFRPFNWPPFEFNQLPFHLTAQWGADCHLAFDCPRSLRSCIFVQNLYRDPQCEWSVSAALGLTGPPSTLAFWQRVAQPDQLWIYSRDLLRDVVRRVEATTNATFARSFPLWRIADASFYTLAAIHSALEAAAAGTPPLQPLLNLPMELQRAFPEAHAKCCSCEASGERPRPPCVYLNDVFSPCLVKAAGAQALAHFVTHVTGMFGYWHQAVRPEVDAALAEEPQLAWCVNNCFNVEMLARLSQVRERNRTMHAALSAYPLVRSAFLQGESMGVLGGRQNRTAARREHVL